MDRLEQGLIEGALRFEDRAPPRLPTKPPKHRPAEAPFRSPAPISRPRVALVVGGASRRSVYRTARALSQRDCEVTIIDFQVKAKRLRVWFEEGIWMHVGGVLGRDRFDAPLPRPRRCLRAKREIDRIAARRRFDAVIRPAAPKFRLGDLRATSLEGTMHGFVLEPLKPGAGASILKLLAPRPRTPAPA